jgi:hypothetical protein
MSNADYQHGASPRRVKGGDITKRPRSKAAKSSGPASTAHSASPLPSELALKHSDPHGRCNVDPCPHCHHALMRTIGLRHGSPVLGDWEREEI